MGPGVDAERARAWVDADLTERPLSEATVRLALRVLDAHDVDDSVEVLD